MKQICLLTLLMSITLFTVAQESKIIGSPPVKSGTSLPLSRVVPSIPLRTGENNLHPSKIVQLVTVPVRKADPSGNSHADTDKTKTSQGKTAKKLLSDYSIKEAGAKTPFMAVPVIRAAKQ